MASTDQPAVSASTGAGQNASTTTVSQTALTSVLAASWSVLLPQITATIGREVGEAMQQANRTPTAASDAAGIISSPQSTNVTVNTTATFECTTEGGPLYWTVNGSDSPTEWGDGITYDTRQSGIRQSSTLMIMASLSRNNTVIKCAVLSIESDAVILLIQGLLGAPTGLSVDADRRVMVLNWQEPFTLDITGIEQDISYYTVVIENTLIGGIHSVNTSSTQYMFEQQSSVESCTVFRFHVSAVNLAGFGESSVAVNGSFNMPPILEATTYSDDQGIVLTCNASCLSNFVLWIVNGTLPSDNPDGAYFLPSSNKITRCYMSQNTTTNFYSEKLHLNTTGYHLHPTTFSCAAVYLCTREEELTGNCTPIICNSRYQDYSTLSEFNLTTDSSAEISTTTLTNQDGGTVVLSTTQQPAETIHTPAADAIMNLNSTLTYGVAFLGVAVVILILFATLMTTLFIIMYKKWKKEKVSHSLQVQGVIYEEPRVLSDQPTIEQMQQCPAYQCISRRS